MRFDEAGGDPHVRLDPLAVQEDRHVPDQSQVDERAAVAGVVVDDPAVPDDVLAEHREEFRRRVRAVRPGGDQHHDVLGADHPVEGLEDRPEHQLPWLRTRDVADGDRDGLARMDQARERWARDRLGERPTQVGQGIGGCRPMSRRHDRRPVARDLDRQARFAIGQADRSRCAGGGRHGLRYIIRGRPPVAQWIRATDFGSVGRGFESLRAGQINRRPNDPTSGPCPSVRRG